MKPASNKAADLLAAAPIKFEALEDFYSEEFLSTYLNGFRYTLKLDRQLNERTGQNFAAKLAVCMEKWLDEGKIALVDPSQGTGGTGASAVSGTGVVT